MSYLSLRLAIFIRLYAMLLFIHSNIPLHNISIFFYVYFACLDVPLISLVDCRILTPGKLDGFAEVLPLDLSRGYSGQ